MRKKHIDTQIMLLHRLVLILTSSVIVFHSAMLYFTWTPFHSSAPNTFNSLTSIVIQILDAMVELSPGTEKARPIAE